MAASKGFCLWKQDDEGTWDTKCGHAFVFNEGTPKENDMRFCPYCGKALKEKEYDYGSK